MDKNTKHACMDLRPVLSVVLDEYPLPLWGDHGLSHWARVWDNGQRLCPETGGDPVVVSLFAILHDSQRQNEVTDPEHGPRAAEFCRVLGHKFLGIDRAQLELLCVACHGHTHQRTHPDRTVQTCWDADRLDLGRVGVMPHPDRLCTEFAKREETILWADGRASFRVVPDWVEEKWGIAP